MNTKITVTGLKEIANLIKKNDAIKEIVPDITIAVLKLHNTLERNVNSTYTNPKLLSTVLLGSSVQDISKTFLRFGLQYRQVSVPLSDYKMVVSGSTSISAAPMRRADGGITWKLGTWSKTYKSEVVRGKFEQILPYKNRKNPAGSKFAFTNFEGSDAIVVRKRQTWQVRPTRGREGIRTKLTEQYGPTLAYLANITYNNDIVAREKATNDIIKAFTDYYKVK